MRSALLQTGFPFIPIGQKSGLQSMRNFCSFVSSKAERLESWTNTAARLAGCRKMTQQGGILYVIDGQHHLSRSGADFLQHVHKTPSWDTSRKEGIAWYSSRPMPSLRLCLPALIISV